MSWLGDCGESLKTTWPLSLCAAPKKEDLEEELRKCLCFECTPALEFFCLLTVHLKGPKISDTGVTGYRRQPVMSTTSLDFGISNPVTVAASRPPPPRPPRSPRSPQYIRQTRPIRPPPPPLRQLPPTPANRPSSRGRGTVARAESKASTKTTNGSRSFSRSRNLLSRRSSNESIRTTASKSRPRIGTPSEFRHLDGHNGSVPGSVAGSIKRANRPRSMSMSTVPFRPLQLSIHIPGNELPALPTFLAPSGRNSFIPPLPTTTSTNTRSRPRSMSTPAALFTEPLLLLRDHPITIPTMTLTVPRKPVAPMPFSRQSSNSSSRFSAITIDSELEEDFEAALVSPPSPGSRNQQGARTHSFYAQRTARMLADSFKIAPPPPLKVKSTLPSPTKATVSPSFPVPRPFAPATSTTGGGRTALVPLTLGPPVPTTPQELRSPVSPMDDSTTTYKNTTITANAYTNINNASPLRSPTAPTPAPTPATVAAEYVSPLDAAAADDDDDDATTPTTITTSPASPRGRSFRFPASTFSTYTTTSSSAPSAPQTPAPGFFSRSASTRTQASHAESTFYSNPNPMASPTRPLPPVPAVVQQHVVAAPVAPVIRKASVTPVSSPRVRAVLQGSPQSALPPRLSSLSSRAHAHAHAHSPSPPPIPTRAAARSRAFPAAPRSLATTPSPAPSSALTALTSDTASTAPSSDFSDSDDSDDDDNASVDTHNWTFVTPRLGGGDGYEGGYGGFGERQRRGSTGTVTTATTVSPQPPVGMGMGRKMMVMDKGNGQVRDPTRVLRRAPTVTIERGGVEIDDEEEDDDDCYEGLGEEEEERERLEREKEMAVAVALGNDAISPRCVVGGGAGEGEQRFEDMGMGMAITTDGDERREMVAAEPKGWRAVNWSETDAEKEKEKEKERARGVGRRDIDEQEQQWGRGLGSEWGIAY